jgi:hypothetical protein
LKLVSEAPSKNWFFLHIMAIIINSGPIESSTNSKMLIQQINAESAFI